MSILAHPTYWVFLRQSFLVFFDFLAQLAVTRSDVLPPWICQKILYCTKVHTYEYTHVWEFRCFHSFVVIIIWTSCLYCTVDILSQINSEKAIYHGAPRTYYYWNRIDGNECDYQATASSNQAGKSTGTACGDQGCRSRQRILSPCHWCRRWRCGRLSREIQTKQY